MKILLDNEKRKKHPYVATILRELESKLGEEVIVSRFDLVDEEVLLELKSVQNNQNYNLRITKLCQFDPRIGRSSRSIFISDDSDHVEEYICDITDYSHCYKENDIYYNGDITLIKGRPFTMEKTNWVVYTLKKDNLELKIITPYGDEIFDSLGNIEEIDLISAYHQLEKKNPAFVQNIVFELHNYQTNSHEVLSVENGQLKKYERDYVNTNNVAINLIYTENGIEVLTKQNIFYDESEKISTIDITNDIAKVKSLFK